jgi:two-component system CheB/CheR fusion protein
VVTHLSPDRESLLHEIIARYTEMPVHVAEDGMQVEVDNVYVLPANSSSRSRNAGCRSARSGTARERKPIDIFFASLAVDLGELSAGVVLSGGDGDGTLGIKAIKERGGLTLAQVADGFGPKHPSMPDSAISTGLVDFAIPADMMGAKLVEFVRAATFRDGILAGAAAEGPARSTVP